MTQGLMGSRRSKGKRRNNNLNLRPAIFKPFPLNDKHKKLLSSLENRRTEKFLQKTQSTVTIHFTFERLTV
jgi:hypothetical protein